MSEIIFSRVFEPNNGGENVFVFTKRKKVLGLDFEVAVKRLPESALVKVIANGLPNNEGIEETTGLPLKEVQKAHRHMYSIKRGPINA